MNSLLNLGTDELTRRACRAFSLQELLSFRSLFKVHSKSRSEKGYVDYIRATNYVPPQICACCSPGRLHVEMLPISVDSASDYLPLHLDLLQVPQTVDLRLGRPVIPSTDFEFESHPHLSGLMLDPAGLHFNLDNPTSSSVLLCSECHSSLSHCKIPRMALRNGLYRGRLPEEFSDITWVEEMVCSLYRNTAHVTRLYQSSNPADPFFLHGNTCAFDTNIISTATVLPRTPADILGQLSVVFVGPGPVKPAALKKLFRVRKPVIMRFLKYLFANNVFYRDLAFSLDALNQYPDDGALPGLFEQVVHDERPDASDIFQEETAGLDEHPASAARNTSQGPGDDAIRDEDDPEILLENMGVSDPECHKISGRAFKAAALRNLLADAQSQCSCGSSERPDLVIPRGAVPISEYNNPRLFPGMFPTLFPLGIGGFEEPISVRPTALSFQKQAEYYFDINDRSFRYHRYFMFVALNIIQRRTSHLQTHFTVQRNNFDAVAEKLISVRPDVIQSVANHLEHEGKYSELSGEQLEVLNRVNTVAARIPGSQASKILARNTARAYMGMEGLPHIYLTLNTNPASPTSPCVIFNYLCFKFVYVS